MIHFAGEFTSRSFDDYCMSLGINVEHHVPHVHTQNDLAEAFIKRMKLITHALLMKMKLPSFLHRDIPFYMMQH